jgi:hypothetical protein
MGRLKRAVRWWATGWTWFVEATRGSTNGMAGPNPWGETIRNRTERNRG